VVLEKPKGAQEGFEIRLTWPSSIASCEGTIKQITDSRIQISRKADGRTISLALSKKRIKLLPLVRMGEPVLENQIIAAAVPVTQSIPCTKTASVESYLEQTKSTSVAERYAAVKALGRLDPGSTSSRIEEIVGNEDEHIYVRMESAASLMRLNRPPGSTFIKSCLNSEYLENRLEAVIALSEIESDESKQILVECLKDNEQHPEIRAGAAWALGELDANDSLPVLIGCFVSVDQSIKIEAARALSKIAREHNAEVLTKLPESQEDERPGVAWALAKAGIPSIKDLLPTMVDNDTREWAAYIIGSQPSERFVREIEQLKQKDTEVYFAVTVLWKIFSSWIYGLEEY
jgi:HEAT repeat protein